MKNLFYAFMCFGMLFFASCDKDESNESITYEASIEEATLSDQVKPEQKLLAKIQKNGHEFKFIEVGTESSVLVIHKLNEASQNDEFASLLDNQERTPFNIFASLTDATVEVPQAIAATAKNGALALSGRKISSSSTPLELLDPGFKTSAKAACYDEGTNGFRIRRCGLVISNLGDIRFCDNGTWTTHIRNSVFGGVWRSLDDTTTWTNVICGKTRMQFFGNGVLESEVDLFNGIWRINYYTNTNKRRQVKRFRPNNTGKFRAYTRFF